MAIIKMIKNPPVNKKQLWNVIDYIKQPGKTRPDLVGGKDCDWENAYREFNLVKQEFEKEGGIQAKHMVMSFDVKDDITVELAKQLADELVTDKLFDGFQVLYAVHQDKDHIHTHFLINSVNMENGKRWHQTAVDLRNLKQHSNELCRQHGLSEITIDKGDGAMSDIEIRNRFDSWKYELYLAAVNAAHRSVDKEDFKDIMKSLGYGVSWEDDKKYITFTTPEGRKCRNRKLYPRNRFTKNALERQFDLNADRYGIDELSETQERFIRMVNNVDEDEKYPISSLVEKYDDINLEGMNYNDWYDINREISIDDDKYETYRSMGYAMKRAVDLDDFKSRLQHMGMDAEFNLEANISVFVSKQGVEYDNTELYMGEHYTPSELKKLFLKNADLKQFKDFFRNAAFEARSMEELRGKLLEEGYTLEYENGVYSLHDADGNPVDTSALNKDFDTLYKESGIIKFLFNHKWSAESFDEFIETIQTDGCDVQINENEITYLMYGQEYQKETFNLKELEEYYARRLDRKELRSVLWQVRHCAKSSDDFIDKMSKLGYKVEWYQGGKINFITPSGRTFSNDSLQDDALTQEHLEEQFAQNEVNDNFDLFVNIMRLLRHHDSTPMSSSGLTNQDLTGEKLRDFLYHFEKGSASRYNKNLNNDMSM